MSFKSFNLNESSYSDTLMKNMVLWIDDGFYKSSGYVSRSETLYQVDHPSYGSGIVFGSSYKNWVWEDDSISVNVDSNPVSGFNINYKEGLVIFNSPQSGVVECDYKSKHINVFDADSNEFFRGSNLTKVFSGVYREEAIQLPCIALKEGPSISFPVSLGSIDRRVRQEVICSIFHRNSSVASVIADTLYKQIDRDIILFDFNEAYRSGVYPLELNGQLINRSGTYDYLTENFHYQKALTRARITEAEKENPQKLDNQLFHHTIRFTIECDVSMS